MTIPGYRQYGDDIENGALVQMNNACALPVAVKAALMPDAHQGYGLPIGGVLATDNAVIPYAVGVDIACRMKLTVLDYPVDYLERGVEKLKAALMSETAFGLGAAHKPPLEHPVLDEDWDFSAVTRKVRAKAVDQLGTSGGGNHFASFGELVLERPCSLGTGEALPAGRYVAALSHSGSRGAGLAVAEHYCRLAMQQRRAELPKEQLHLAWLDLDTDAGREYWAAMELMGRYAAANHELIHKRLVRHLKAHVVGQVENHHNFAWRERHLIDGVEREVVVHRKGATPMAAGVLGVIPGTMADPGFVVDRKSTRLNSSH